MNVKDLIHTGDFCQVASDKFVEHGVKRNHLVYVAGSKALPLAENDPYTQRIKFFVHRMDNDHVDTSQLYLMDPDSLAKISKTRQKKLTKILRKDIGEDSTN